MGIRNELARWHQLVRDWRIWALTLTIQLPGARAVARYGPRPAVLLAILVLLASRLYSAFLGDTTSPALRRIGSPWGISILVGVMAAVSLTLYPTVDALKHAGRGSDQDDAVIETTRRLFHGDRPIYVPTYLGNAPSAGPGWILLVSPLALTGGYGLLTPLACGVLAWTVRAASGGRPPGPALALLLPLSSPGFWELLVTGSDYFAIGVLFVALAAVAHRWRARNTSSVLVGAILTAAAASSRVVFAGVTACLAGFMLRTGRRGGWVLAAVTAAVVAGEWWAWWPDRDGQTPLHLVSKGATILGGGAVTVTVLAAAVAFWTIARIDDDLSSWWRSLWVVLVVPLAFVSLADLLFVRLVAADWGTASYLEVAVAPLVAFVSLGQVGGTAYKADFG